MIIAGHGRVEAAKLLGLTEVPTVCLTHMSEAQKRAYVLADNRLAEKAGWDKDILAIEFQALIELAPELDLTVTGFELAEIDLTRAALLELRVHRWLAVADLILLSHGAPPFPRAVATVEKVSRVVTRMAELPVSFSQRRRVQRGRARLLQGGRDDRSRDG